MAHHKTTIGINAQVLIGKGVAYTTDADYETFVANAVDGEIGIFLASDNSLVNAAVDDGTEVYAAVKIGDQFRKSTTFKKGDNIRKIAYEAPVKQVSHIGNNGVNGAIDVTPEAGAAYTVAIIETTPGYEPYPRWSYTVTAGASETVSTLIDKLVARINDDTVPENGYNPRLVTAAKVSTNGISLTAIENGVHFEVVVRDGLAGQQVRKTTLFNPGAGTPEWVTQLEKEGNTFAGVTTYNARFAEDYGQPVSAVNPAVGYNTYFINNLKTAKSKGKPNKMDTEYSNIIIAVPSSGTNPTSALDTALIADPVEAE